MRLRVNEMSSGFFLLAAVLGLAALAAGAWSFVPIHGQPGLPSSGSPFRTAGLVLLSLGLLTALLGMLTRLFEQVERRSEARRKAERQSQRAGRSSSEG